MRRELIFAVALLAGCAETTFSPHFRDNEVVDIRAAMAKRGATATGAPRNASGKPMVFMVTREPTRVVAYDLSAGSVRWTAQADATSKIVVGHSLIFFRSGARKIAAHHVSDGRLAWSTEILGGDRLVGMSADGDQLYYVTENSRREGKCSAAHLVALGSGGEKRWIQESSGRLGAPLARAGVVYLPFRFQSLAILDASDGVELARIRSKEEALSWVRDSAAGVLYGGASGVYLLDEKSASGRRQTSSFLAAPLPKTVQPVYWWDGYNAALSGYTAYDRNRLLWQVVIHPNVRTGTTYDRNLWQVSPQRLGFLNDTVIVHNYRFFFAFDSNVPADKPPVLRWVYNYPRQDVVASELVDDALVLVTAAGEVVVVDPRVGAMVGNKALKLPAVGATFDVGGYKPAVKGAVRADIRRALSEVIWDPDRRFGAVKIFCIEQLGQLPGGNVGEDLLKIVTQSGIDPAVYKRAGEMLVARHDKQSIPLYLRILQKHSDFVEGAQARGVDMIARALGDLKAKEAVRPLLMHLADHETPLPAIADIVAALTAIGDSSIVEPFRDFLLTYRCDPEFERAPAALTSVADALLRMGGEQERQMLSFVENDIHTLLPLRTYLGELLKQKPATPSKSATSSK